MICWLLASLFHAVNKVTEVNASFCYMKANEMLLATVINITSCSYNKQSITVVAIQYKSLKDMVFKYSLGSS